MVDRMGMESLRLSAKDIMAATEKSFAFFTDNGVDKKIALRLQFAAEEVLLAYQQKFGEDAEFELYPEKRMGVPRIVFRIAGDSCDPFAGLNDDDRLMHALMENLGAAPVWNYRRSCNEVTFTAGRRKTLSSLTLMLIAIALGIGLGALARMLPETVVHEIGENWLAPVQNAIMGLLSTVSAMYVFLSVISGICGMGDVSTFNRIGRKLILHLLLSLLIVTVLSAAALLLFFPLSGDAAGQTNYATLWQMIVNIIPSNLVETFSSGNTMQIVFLSLLIGTILLITGPKSQQLVEVTSQLTNLFQRVIQKVIAFMPAAVFVSLFRLVADGSAARLLDAYKYPLILFIFCAAYLIIQVLINSVRHHMSPFLLMKKLMPTLLVALSTSSSAAALPENLNTCENRLGIDRRIINVGIPLGQIIYMPGVVLLMMVGVLCSAQIFSVPLSLPAYVIFIVTAYIITIATPPVPGASAASFALLLTQMGIPLDAMTILLALDAFADRIATGTNIMGLQIELINAAKSVDRLDGQKLHAAE